MKTTPATVALCLLFIAGHSPESRADEPVAATPAVTASSVALLDAVSRAPVLTAALRRAEAARARIGASGRFPDPEIEGMLSNIRNADGNFPMWEVSLRQPLPKAGERSADRARASAALSMAEADYAVMAGEMAAETAMAVAEAATARERTALLTAQIGRMEKTLGAIDARIASGSGRSADRLVLQSRIDSMRLMVAKDERMAEDALAEARGRLGLAPDAALPDFAFPAAGEIAAESAPQIQLSAARAAEARAMVRMARAGARPMTAVGLKFSHEEMAMDTEDVVGIAFMTEIPWRGRGYARAEERAARAEEAASRAEGDITRHRVTSALSRVERAARLAATTRTFADDARKRLDAEYDALIRSAGVASPMGGDSSALMIVMILERQTDAQLQVIEAEGAVRSARAELWRYAPAALFSPKP